MHKLHELRLSSASRAPCGQLPLQSSAPSVGRSYKDTEATATCVSKHQADEPAWGASGTGATAESGTEGGPAAPQRGGRTPKLSSGVNHLSSFTEGFKKMGQWGGRITRRSSKTPQLLREASPATRNLRYRKRQICVSFGQTERSSLFGLIKNISYKNKKH